MDQEVFEGRRLSIIIGFIRHGRVGGCFTWQNSRAFPRVVVGRRSRRPAPCLFQRSSCSIERSPFQWPHA